MNPVLHKSNKILVELLSLAGIKHISKETPRITRCRSLVHSRQRFYGRPRSRSARRTHLRNVSLVQPIFSAIELIVDHCDEYSRS